MDEKLRPQRLGEIIGQRRGRAAGISLAAAKKRGEPLPHILFDGPPGLGKTTFATVLHNELGVELNMTSGRGLDKKMDVMPYLTNAAEGSILFIDEIHRMPRAGRRVHLPGDGRFPGRRRARRGDVCADGQYPAQEIHDHRRDDPQRDALGAAARPLRHARAPGVLRRGRPRQDRHDQCRQAPHDGRRRGRLGAGAAEPGTPRLANARLRWVRDYALARADGHISLSIARDALDMQEIDTEGLDKQDRRYLETLISVFPGGPTGCDALAATMNIAVDTLEEEVEPYLLRRHFVVRTPRGRRATPLAYRHLGLPEPVVEPELPLFDPQRRLFE